MRLLFGFLVLISCATAPVSAADLRIHGSNTVGGELMPALLRGWMESLQCGQIKHEQLAPEESQFRCTKPDGNRLLVDLHAHGTSTGFRDLLVGQADVAMASRPLSAAERDAGFKAKLGDLNDAGAEQVLALDGIAIVVSKIQTVQALSLAQLRGIFAGEIRNWRLVGGPDLAIELHARDSQSGTFDTFKSLVLGEAAIAQATRYEDSAALVRTVTGRQGAIGFTGLAAVGNAKVLRIRDSGVAMAPTRAMVATEDYLLARRLFLYASANRSGAVRDFLQYSQSAAGQAIVDAIGFVSMQVGPVLVAAPDEAPLAYVQETNGYARLNVNFRFGSGSALLDSRAEHDLQRLRAYALAHPGQRLRLLGFSDRSDDVPYSDLMISIDRADYVAARLTAIGVPVERVRGFGGALPVASNASSVGRARNRRVEVWFEGDNRLSRN